jgi:hypothetical protein
LTVGWKGDLSWVRAEVGVCWDDGLVGALLDGGLESLFSSLKLGRVAYGAVVLMYFDKGSLFDKGNNRSGCLLGD